MPAYLERDRGMILDIFPAFVDGKPQPPILSLETAAGMRYLLDRDGWYDPVGTDHLVVRRRDGKVLFPTTNQEIAATLIQVADEPHAYLAANREEIVEAIQWNPMRFSVFGHQTLDAVVSGLGHVYLLHLWTDTYTLVATHDYIVNRYGRLCVYTPAQFEDTFIPILYPPEDFITGVDEITGQLFEQREDPADA